MGSYTDHNGHSRLRSYLVSHGHACSLQQSPEARHGLSAERLEPVLQLLLKAVKSPSALSAQESSGTVGFAGSCSYVTEMLCCCLDMLERSWPPSESPSRTWTCPGSNDTVLTLVRNGLLPPYSPPSEATPEILLEASFQRAELPAALRLHAWKH